MFKPDARSKHFARALVTLKIGSQILVIFQRSTRSAAVAYKEIVRKVRKVEGWLKLNPIAVLLLFPLVATPARFAKSQRRGLAASLLATTMLLWSAAGFWASAMQELAAKSLRMMEGIHHVQMDEITKQQLELIFSAILGKPMGFLAATFIFLMGCFRAAWYRGFMAIYYRSRGHRPIVGLHYFLVQSSSRAFYLGVLMNATCFAINNWAWLEAPVYRMAGSGYMLIPVLIFGVVQYRYSQQKKKVDRQLYGSWLAELTSKLSALVATVLTGWALMWLLGLGVRYLGTGSEM